jgi:hypothetical protein
LGKSEVARVDGIILVDLSENSTRFRDCALAALERVKACDPLRYRRIQRRLSWVVNCTLPEPGMAEYHHDTRSCEIDFDERRYETDPEASVALLGSTLVHEATHGTVRAHGILYTPELRSRIERICVAEENRFLDHVAQSQHDLARRIRYDFDEARWHSAWKTTPAEKLFRIFRRLRTE